MARPRRKPPVSQPEALHEADIVPLRQVATGTRVRWTKLGEKKRAWSEHGMHKAGELVITEQAETLIERGYAEPV